jgi:hypothetical protein
VSEATDVLFHDWNKLLKDEAGRSLIYSSNIVPAHAEITSALAKAQNLHYMNGTWREDLGFGLLWYVFSQDLGHGHGRDKMRCRFHLGLGRSKWGDRSSGK